MTVPLHRDERSALYESLIAELLDRQGESAEVLRDELLDRHPDLADEIALALEVCAMAQGEGLRPWPVVGEVLGSYRLKRVIGRGSFGVVYEAWDERLERYVALKLLSLRRGREEDATDVDAALREARSAAGIDHPNVVQVHAAGRLSDAFGYIDAQLAGDAAPTAEDPHALEVGRSLGDLAAARSLGMRRLAAIVSDAARGVAAAHARGVVHRDLKPANLIVTPRGRVLVSDFGLAGSADVFARSHDGTPNDDPTATLMGRDGHLAGSPAFMAPEQARGEAATPASDVYGLGITLHALLVGEAPFRARETSALAPIEDVLLQVGEGSRPRLAALREDLPESLCTIVDHATASRPEDRYASAAELARDLDAWLAHRPVSVERAGAGRRTRLFLMRHPVGATLTLVFLVAAIGLSAWFVSNLRRARDEAEAGLARYRQMADVRRVRELIAEGERLWPRRPHMIAKMTAWLDGAGAVLDNEAVHRGAVARLRESARGSEVPRFARNEDAWRFEVLEKLLKDLEQLESLRGDVQRRRRFAEVVRQATVDGETARASWTRCRRSIAALPVYAGIELEPVVGVVPLGRDAASGLWEFWHVGSGRRPRWEGEEEAGHAVPEDDSGLVFVLLPVQGEVVVGAQKEAPDAPRFDPHALVNERPALKSAVTPFMISKYEMTQGQWKLVMGKNPAYYRPPRGKTERFTPRHPVESVPWRTALNAALRLGLTLPTEIEWEVAARAGTTSVWWTGNDVESLAGAGNLRDVSVAGYSTNDSYERALSDGRRVHAPVGSYRANPWGLHDVIGNVGEWCLHPLPDPEERDGSEPFVRSRHRPGKEPRLGYRVARGGSFQSLAIKARSASRATVSMGAVGSTVGLRPVLLLSGPE